MISGLQGDARIHISDIPLSGMSGSILLHFRSEENAYWRESICFSGLLQRLCPFFQFEKSCKNTYWIETKPMSVMPESIILPLYYVDSQKVIVQ